MKIKELIGLLEEYDGNMDVYVSNELDRDPSINIKLGCEESYPSRIKKAILLL